jgi:glycerophosphoryl diester phosphodiesterase
MIVVGHRGARGEAPENTLPGFAYAKSLGLTTLEFDIQLTKDDQLVVIHDATVDRTTNGTGAVADLTLAEIQALDARSIHPDWPEPCFVPTFEQVLEAVKDFASLEIEIKKDAPERIDRVIPKVLEQLAASGYAGDATITSFETYPLELVQQQEPDRKRGFIGAWDSQEYLDTAIRLGAGRACVNGPKGSLEIVRAAQKQGFYINGWPTNTAEALAQFQAWNCDCVCSDHPTLILDLLSNA